MQRIILLFSTTVLICLVLVNLPVIYVRIQSNLIMVMLVARLLHSNTYHPENRSLLSVLNNDVPTVGLAQSVKQYATWDKTGIASQWSLGRLSLAVGNTQTAYNALYPLSQAAVTNPFLYLDLLQSSTSEQAIKLYQTTPPTGAIKAISDTIALAYLVNGAARSLPNVLLFRPEDLYANYFLWQEDTQYDINRAEKHHEKIKDFTEASLITTHPQLLAYITEIVPLLLANGVWNVETAQTVVSYLVWKYHTFLDIERLLEHLITKYPETPGWRFLLGELYERNGDLVRAEQMYRDTLRLDKDCWLAIRHLGFVLQMRSEQSYDHTILLEAKALYEHYLTWKPNDIVVLHLLLTLDERLELPQTQTLREQLVWLRDNQSYVADILDVSSSVVEIGANLLPNGELTTWVQNKPQKFVYVAYTGANALDGAFAGGRDQLELNSLRLLTLRVHKTVHGNLPYAEYVSDKVLIGPNQYLVTIEYCTEDFEVGYPLIYLGQYDNVNGIILLHTSLPQLSGGCGLARFIVEGPAAPTKVALLVRNWGEGDLKVLSLALQEFTLLKY